MASTRPSRRSAQNRRYNTDAFDGIEDLQSEVESPASIDDDGDNDKDEFQSDAASSEADDADHANSDVDTGGLHEHLSDQASEPEDEETISRTADTQLAKSSSRAPGWRAKQLVVDPDKVFNRGIIDSYSTATSVRHLLYFGPDQGTRHRIKQASINWQDGVSLPTRRALAANTGYRELVEAETQRIDDNWRWYDKDGGALATSRQQEVSHLEGDASQIYLLSSFVHERDFIMGPVDNPRCFKLQVRESISLDEAFFNHRTMGLRRGFVINVGVRIACLRWAPSQNGADQFLAVSLLPQRDMGRASSFEPQPAVPASIQVWKMTATTQSHIDTTISPTLYITFCADMGDITAFEWCPVPANHNDRLGLLACISTDGYIRVFQVPRAETPPLHLKIEKAAFQLKPPDTVCTSVTWMSSSHIAVACANGFIMVCNLDEVLRSERSTYRPHLYFGVTTTYITSITSCYPSHPYFVQTISMAGYITLTDLRQPSALVSRASATGTSAARQLSQPQILWMDVAQGSLSFDDNYTIRGFPVRRLFTATRIGRLRAATIAAAASPCHPYVLVGLTNGEAVAFNPLRRATQTSRKQEPIFAQTWFQHEWRWPTELERSARDVDAEGDTTMDGGSTSAGATRRVATNGMSRISEGFKLQPMIASGGKDDDGPKVKAGVDFTTIYEEQTAVTAVAWNPNAHVGGWAAAGMADGLIRVEDLAIG